MPKYDVSCSETGRWLDVIDSDSDLSADRIAREAHGDQVVVRRMTEIKATKAEEVIGCIRGRHSISTGRP